MSWSPKTILWVGVFGVLLFIGAAIGLTFWALKRQRELVQERSINRINSIKSDMKWIWIGAGLAYAVGVGLIFFTAYRYRTALSRLLPVVEYEQLQNMSADEAKRLFRRSLATKNFAQAKELLPFVRYHRMQTDCWPDCWLKDFVQSSTPEMVEFLLKNGAASPTAVDRQGRSLLWYLLTYNQFQGNQLVEIVDTYFKYAGKVEIGASPLFVNDDPTVCLMLLDNGARTHRADGQPYLNEWGEDDERGEDVLSHMVKQHEEDLPLSKDWIRCLERLVEHVDLKHHPALSNAVSYAMIDWLLEHGARANSLSELVRKHEYFLSDTEKASLVPRYILAGAEVDHSAIRYAMERELEQTTNALIEAGGRIRPSDFPLLVRLPVEMGRSVVKRTYESDPDVLFANSNQLLKEAVSAINQELIEYLLELGLRLDEATISEIDNKMRVDGVDDEYAKRVKRALGTVLDYQHRLVDWKDRTDYTMDKIMRSYQSNVDPNLSSVITGYLFRRKSKVESRKSKA